MNPDNDFVLDDNFEEIKLLNNLFLFKKAINENVELKEVIWIAIYHSLNTFNVKNEFLTVLSKKFILLADLIEGDERSVEIPKKVKEEILNENVLATFHNHFNGAILPSSNDIKNTIIPFIKFMVITSNGNIGIIVNDNDDYNDNLIELFKQDWIMFLSYVNWSFNNDMREEIQELYDLKLSKSEKEKEEFILFDKYLGDNLQRFIDEFNLRMEKFNVYFLQISIKER